MKQFLFKNYAHLCVGLLRGFIIFMAINTQFVFANELSPPPISLADAVKRTLADNPQLHEFEFRQQALHAEAKTAELKPAYKLGLELENVLGTGEISGLKGAELTLTLSSVIELGDKSGARAQFIDAKRQQQGVEKKIRTLDLLAEVTRRYIEVLAQQETVAIVEDAEELARYTYQAVANRVDAGASALSEKKRAEAALAYARLTAQTAKQHLQTTLRSLSIMWGEHTPAFTRVQGDLFSFAKTPSFDMLLAVLNRSPDVMLLAEQTRVQQARLRLIEANNRPDIDWSAGVRRINEIHDTAFVAGVSVPLFSEARNLPEYQAQTAKIEQIEQQKQANLRNLLHQVNQTLDARNRALLAVDTLKQHMIPPLKEALSLIEKAYSDGRFSYLEWVSTRQDFLDTQLSLVRAAAEVHQRSTDIEALTGTTLFFTHSDKVSNNLSTDFSALISK